MTKPVDLDQIAGLLRPWVATQESAAPQTPAPAPRVPVAHGLMGANFPVIAGINRVKAANLLGGNQALFCKFLDNFACGYAGVVAEIQGDLAQGEPAKAARRLHKVRGAAANICAFELMQQAGMLEEALLQGETHIEAGLKVLGHQIEALIAASAPWRTVATTAEEAGPADPPPPASPA